MPWFHRESPEERQRREEAEAAARQQQQAAAGAAREEALIRDRSRQQLEAGGLPVRAQERIAQIRNGAVPLFSSNLSVDELTLARQSGYAPLGLVSGASVYHVGWNRWTVTGELSAETQALGAAVYTALDRLRQEAQGMGALGVVGVELKIEAPGWGERLVETVVTGTAINVHGSPPAPQPFLSGISMQEYWSLLRSGVRPAGLVFGNSAFYIYSGMWTRMQTASWFNQEVGLYAQALRGAQGLAFGRLHQAAAATGASGIIGVNISHTLTPIEYEVNDTSHTDYVIEYRAWGTAIVEAPAHSHVEPRMVFDLQETAR